MKLEYNPIVGYQVRAAIDLEPNTLICEYSGSVRTCQQVEFSQNDSIMELLTVKAKNSGEEEDPARSLVIYPEAHSGIGRFFNGINNSEKGSKRLKQNLMTMRVRVPAGTQGSKCSPRHECRVLIYTFRKIKAGEVLLYDYNEG